MFTGGNKEMGEKVRGGEGIWRGQNRQKSNVNTETKTNETVSVSHRHYIKQAHEPHSTRQAQLDDTSPIPVDLQNNGMRRVEAIGTGRNAQFCRVPPLARNHMELRRVKES